MTPAAPVSVAKRVKGLTRDSLVYGAGMAAQKVAGLILLPVLTRIFDPGTYGAIDLIGLGVVMATYLVVLGNDTALLRFYHDTEAVDERLHIASLCIGFRTMVALAIMICLVPLAPALTGLMQLDARFVGCVTLAAIDLPFATLVKFFIDFLQVRLRPGAFGVFSVGNLVLFVALTLWLAPGAATVAVPLTGWSLDVTGMGFGVVGVFMARLIADMVFALAGIVVMARDLVWPRRLQPLGAMLRFGLPLVPVGVATWVLSYADRYILNSAVSIEQAGIYAVGAKPASFMLLFVAAFQFAWGPFAISIWRDSNARQVYAKVFSLYVFVAGVVGLVVTGLSREFLNIVATGHFVHGYRVSGFLVFAAAAYGAFAIPATGLQIVRRTALMGAVAAVGAVLNILLNLAWVGRFEALGVAGATLVSQVLTTTLLFAAAHRYYPVPYHWRGAAFGFVTALGLSAVGLAVGRQGTAAALIATGVTTGLYVLVSFATRVIAPADFRMLRHYVQRRWAQG